jgi:hypothetical protein
MTYLEFKNEIADIKAELFTEFDLADALDHVDQFAESRQSVVYYAQAWNLVNMIREADYSLFQEAELMWDETFGDAESINDTMSKLAYCIWTVAITNALYGN